MRNINQSETNYRHILEALTGESVSSDVLSQVRSMDDIGCLIARAESFEEIAAVQQAQS